ncbi:MAG: alkaline phosphatase [Desulfatitalea sp.]|nr:alkaline phosphatase [Desulfatitalea sp.]NNK02484.1 alkaline phosphatase [Desulfatitalea sp.]
MRIACHFLAGFILTAALTLTNGNADTSAVDSPRAKNIIFMVPDGMGLAGVTAARIFKHGPNSGRLSFETLPVIGYQSTHSADSSVTDSAAAASAWACGEKFNNGEISCHDDNTDGICDRTPAPTILDLAKALGKVAGLVVTSDITHATPAAFGANVHHRRCEAEIARQYLARDIDVLLGGGIAKNRAPCKRSSSGSDDPDSLLAAYRASGYAIIDTKTQMNNAVTDGHPKVLGLFKPDGKTLEMFRVNPDIAYPRQEPTLPEMTAAALHLLSRHDRGFFLLVEGSQIDWAGHDNHLKNQIAETLAFDAAVQEVLQWLSAQPNRRQETLLLVVADHETGGFAINGPRGSLAAKGHFVRDGWTGDWHTAVDTLIWAQGPGSPRFGRALDNTDLYGVIKRVLK